MVNRLVPATLLLIAALAVWMNSSVPRLEAADPESLQLMIDKAVSGELVIPPGIYSGPVKIDKPMKLSGNAKVKIYAQGNDPVITVRSDKVSISGVEVVDDRRNSEIPAIVLTGKGHFLDHIRIHTGGIGIQLMEARKSTLTGLEITGWKAPSGTKVNLFSRGNGIDLWGSHDNRIHSCTISNMRDGIYLESSESNRITGNTVTDSRYAVHLMFTKDTLVSGNEGARNVTGAMVMGTDHTTITHNHFYKQSRNVNSQGLLLYDAKNSLVENNRIEGNRIGIYLEQSISNTIRDNRISYNYVGLLAIKAGANQFASNELAANVIQAQALDSSDNDWNGNYWDDAQRIDLQGDGISDLPYRINPFFLMLTQAVPSYRLFFHAPGMILLESLFKGDTSLWLKDAAPLTRSTIEPVSESLRASNIPVLLIHFLLFIFGISIFTFWGVIRK